MSKIKKIKLSAMGNKFINEEYAVLAGPFVPNAQQLAQTSLFTVNLTAEHTDLPSSLSIPIRDYHVPEDETAWNAGLEEVLQKIIHREDVFFGCFGGIGRTGIMLGCLAKAFGVENPNVVYFARTYLHPHALETQEQIDFVKNFNPKNLKQKMEVYHLEHLYKENRDEKSADYHSDPKLEQKTQILLERYKNNPELSFEIISLMFDYEKAHILKNLIDKKYLSLDSVFNNKEAGQFNLLDLAYAYENQEMIQYLGDKKLEPIQEKNKNSLAIELPEFLENMSYSFFTKFMGLSETFRLAYKAKETRQEVSNEIVETEVLTTAPGALYGGNKPNV